jgi:phage tail sheath gpL-like
MPLTSSSLAAATGAAVQNVQFQSGATVLSRKILLIGTYDPLKTSVVDEVPVLITSPEDAGDKFEFGFMLHRMAKWAFAGSAGVECWCQPQAEVAGAKAAGSIDFTGSVPTENAVLHLYIAGEYVPVSVLTTDTPTTIGDKVDDAIAANVALPVTSLNAIGVVAVTAKTTGTYGNDIDLSFNWGFQQKLPAGVTVAITGMTGGTGTPDIEDALDGLGTGDDQNENFFTDVVHGYLQDSTTLDLVSTYNGLGNAFTGNYSKTVSRPFRSLNGDTAAGSAGLSALVAIGTARRATDRTNGIVAVPGSPNHPVEIACCAMGDMAKTNANNAAEHYTGHVLPGIIPGAIADRWTSDYDSRDSAVKAGISPTVVEGGAVKLQNTRTFYHPVGVPVDSNGYASQRNISILQNVLNAIKVNFSQEKWQGISIVSDVSAVGDITARQKARDVNSVLDDLQALAFSFENFSWIYTAAFTIEKFQSGISNYISIRAGGTGFDVIMPIILSGEGSIIDTLVQFDTSLTVLFS